MQKENEHFFQEKRVSQRFNRLMRKLSALNVTLDFELEDKAQLDYARRMRSINAVWKVAQQHLGSPQFALDVGCGFGYGTVFLDLQGVKTVGIEPNRKKLDLGIELFGKAGVNLVRTDQLDFSKSPCVLNTDFNHIEGKRLADLITIFYVSGYFVTNPQTLQTSHRVLKDEGRMLITTEVPKGEAEALIRSFQNFSFAHQILQIPRNYERTAVILRKV